MQHFVSMEDGVFLNVRTSLDDRKEGETFRLSQHRGDKKISKNAIQAIMVDVVTDSFDICR